MTDSIVPQNQKEPPVASPCEPDRVGYGRPPRRSQFKKGESGNPSGRPKRRRSFATDFFAATDAMIPGAAKQTKQRAICEYLIDAAALSHDAFAIKIVVALATSLPDDTSEDRLTAEQAELIEDFDRRQEAAESTISTQDGGDHDAKF